MKIREFTVDTLYNVTKRVIDVILSAYLLLTLAPCLLMIALAIKLDSPGPVLYRQVRVGLRGKMFEMLRFRTMHIESVPEAKYLMERASDKEASFSGPLQEHALKNDPRLTVLGHFLRRYSLNDLPTLINVLKGDMSFVGPRPALPYEVNLYNQAQKERLNVKPGIVGYWVFYAPTHLQEMIEMDLEYSKKRSILLDFWVMMRSISVLLSSSVPRY